MDQTNNGLRGQAQQASQPGASRLALLLAAAERLQPKLHAIFQSLYVEGRSAEDTARRLGVEVTDVERDRRALISCLKTAVI